MNGFLCIDKSAGMTSRDAVNIVQRRVRPVKIGHAGTLDPMATGVLVMALGRATKLISHVQQMKKSYSATFELGKTSDTEDTTGEVEVHEVLTPPSLAEVEAACQRFVGQIMQLPPKYSALKVNGRRAHALARAGEAVELKPRPIVIHSLEITDYAFPVLQMDVCCGSGTYIRSLGRDIGDHLGCGAAMSALRRTRIGRFGIEDSTTAEELTSRQSVEQHLLPPATGVDLPTHQVTEQQRTELRYGRQIQCEQRATEIAAIDDRGELLAVLKRVGESDFRPVINFVAD